MLQDLQFFIDNGNGKKMYFDEVSHARVRWVSPATYMLSSQNGWPSVTSPSVQPNSPDAVADVPNEHVSLFLPSSPTYSPVPRHAGLRSPCPERAC